MHQFIRHLTLAIVAWLSAGLCAAAPNATTLPAGVEARVNGQPILSSQIDSGLRAGIEPELRDAYRTARLMRMVESSIIGQALTERGIVISPKDVEREVDRLRTTPPMLSCGCCGYSSLQEYLQTNGMSDDDLQMEIRRTLGVDLLVEHAWKERYPTPADQQKALQTEGPRIRKSFRKVWQIFTTAQEIVPETAESAAKSRLARQKLGTALDELAKGKSFEDVAKQYSEDKSTASKGGLVGSYATDLPLLGIIDSKRWPSMETGKIHGPYRSWVGYHAIRIEELTDADVLETLHNEFVTGEGEKLWDQLLQAAKLEPETLLHK